MEQENSINVCVECVTLIFSTFKRVSQREGADISQLEIFFKRLKVAGSTVVVIAKL